jgi:hypothetical protein
MNIPTFIKKHKLSSFNADELNEQQLIELRTCSEFANVQKLNIINHKDSFVTQNLGEFASINLHNNIVFNETVNLLGFNIIGPVAISDINYLEPGCSVVETKDTLGNEYKSFVFKINMNGIRMQVLSDSEIVDKIKSYINDYDINDAINPLVYKIGIRVHKNSIKSVTFKGPDLCL